MKVVGIDPGKKGYECQVEKDIGSCCAPASPFFWPAPVVASEEDGPPRYALSQMAALCLSWHGSSVRLVVLERQAPQRRGSGKLGQGKEGTWASWSNGYGFGAWEASLVAVGFVEKKESEVRENSRVVEDIPCYVVVDPLVWKRRMGAVASHSIDDSRGARKRTNDLRTIEVAKKIAPALDLLPTERGGGTKRADSPDKAAAYLLAEYGLRWILKTGESSLTSPPDDANI